MGGRGGGGECFLSPPVPVVRGKMRVVKGVPFVSGVFVKDHSIESGGDEGPLYDLGRLYCIQR